MLLTDKAKEAALHLDPRFVAYHALKDDPNTRTFHFYSLKGLVEQLGWETVVDPDAKVPGWARGWQIPVRDFMARLEEVLKHGT